MMHAVQHNQIRQILYSAKNRLALVSDNPQLEAEILLAQTLQRPRSYLHAWSNQGLSPGQIDAFSDYVSRRMQHEPIAYITGTREFWSMDLQVTAATLIPRPETELLVELALSLCPADRPLKVADLGTGSGAIALALAQERPAWQISATDISDQALMVAKHNADHHHIKNIQFYQGHWCAALPSDDFDLIVSNPPYISEAEWESVANDLYFEPRQALVASGNGLDAIETLVPSAKNHVKPGSYLMVEHGFLQGATVRRLFAAAGFCQIRTVRDINGHERVTLGYSV